MVVVLEGSIRTDHKERIRSFLESKGFRVREIVGEQETIFGAVGQQTIDIREVELLPGVERVIPITKPYKLASRELRKEDTVVRVGPVKIGGNRIVVMAGPCSVENREQILETAEIVRRSGAVVLRGGAYKPRTSPYSFQGLGEEGLRYLKEAGEKTGMPVISEIVSASHRDLMADYVDIFQIGARNMQNFELLKSVGALGRPVMLKRGLAATIEEWLMAAEYLLAAGTDDVILCERGIRTFETYTRHSLDISSIPVVKKLSHLPVIVDPSHATGLRDQVLPVGRAAVAAGADGLIVEVHPNPDQAMSDGPQTLFPEQFEKLMRDIDTMSAIVEKELARLPSPHSEIRLGSAPQKGDSQAAASQKPGSTGGKPVDGAAVAFQGERGAYSEIALVRYFQHENATPSPFDSFRGVFQSVLDGTSVYGIVPIENSLAGSIHENYDLLLEFADIKVVGETQIRIEHCLIGLPGASIDDIRTVYSHPQGLAQCRRFLEAHPGWTAVPFYDTAGSVAFIAEGKNAENAAIAHAEAARLYGMSVIKQGIETNPRNYTRFAIISREELAATETPNKASIVFATPDRPGALFECMAVLAERKVNLKKLESRPIHGKPWTYMFYLDLVIDDVAVFDAAMLELGRKSEDLRVLGVYRA